MHALILPAVRRTRLVCVALFLSSLALHLINIGTPSLWFDEAGQAMAASQPFPAGTLAIAREHAAAMPLDYLVTWGMARFSLEESWLRLPAALWGAGTVVLVFLTFLSISDRVTAALTALLVMLAPIHLNYSQEVRFYASGMFFYWLTVYFIQKAAASTRLKDWAAPALCALVGSYFHVYVLFSFLMAPAWLGMVKENLNRRLVFCLVAGGIATVGFLPGFWYFAREPHLNYPINLAQPVYGFLVGFGWLPFIPLSLLAAILALVTTAIGIGGLVQLIRKRQRSALWLTVAVFGQALISIGFDYASGYFVAPRQFLFFLPLGCFLIAFALRSMIDSGRILNLRGAVSASILGLFAILTVLNVVSYYRYSKSQAREISLILASKWTADTQVWIAPPYEPLLYQFYLQTRMQDDRFSRNLTGVTLDRLRQDGVPQPPRFIITAADATFSGSLDNHPYSRIFSGDAQILWELKP